MKELIEVSRRYGNDSDYVLAGGGNTSLKKDGILYVKASGHALATIDEDGFARMDLKAMNSLWTRDYPSDKDEREELVLADMMASRCPGEEKRPSVEALLHALLEGKYVVHTHPSLVNGLTCGKEGEALMDKLFSDKALWVPLVDPGFVLAKEIRERITQVLEQGKPYPSYIFLQNHGVFVMGDTIEEIDRLYLEIFTILKSHIKQLPQDKVSYPDSKETDEVMEGLRKILGASGRIEVFLTDDLEDMIQNRKSFSSLMTPFSPDHIVYSGLEPLWLEKSSDLEKSWNNYIAKWNRQPKTAVLKGKGCFAFGTADKVMVTARELFIDAARVAVYCESFGGPEPMTEEAINFIANWEVEKYRAAQST